MVSGDPDAAAVVLITSRRLNHPRRHVRARDPLGHSTPPEEVRALDHVSARINAGLLGGISLGALARRTRERSVRST